MRKSRTYRLYVGRIVISIATAIPNTRHPNTPPGSGQVPAPDF
ncbi:MAG TPA: hypothetical protein VFE27_23160 [Acidobacteriaceae bacterium]|nr:hypothetical protein [Acidobacteriaceae bacterium]